MPYTYAWSTLVTLAKKNARNIPTADIDALHCDLVSSKMATVFAWRPQTTTIANGSILLANNTQDYSVPANFAGLVNARLTRTDVSPVQDIELDVRDTLAVNMSPSSPYNIRVIAHQSGEGLLRLEQAIQLDGTWEIRGDIEINPTKVSATSQGCWFDDKYAEVAIAGLLYWLFKVAGDNRAGTAVTDAAGRVSYSGQLGEFMSALFGMKKAEDRLGGETALFPAEPISVGRDGAWTSPFWGN
jgi:hypothetical protein